MWWCLVQSGTSTGSGGNSPSVQHPAAHVLHPPRHGSHHEGEGKDVALQEAVFSPSFHVPQEHQQQAEAPAGAGAGPGTPASWDSSHQAQEEEPSSAEEAEAEFDEDAENKQVGMPSLPRDLVADALLFTAVHQLACNKNSPVLPVMRHQGSCLLHAKLPCS